MGGGGGALGWVGGREGLERGGEGEGGGQVEGGELRVGGGRGALGWGGWEIWCAATILQYCTPRSPHQEFHMSTHSLRHCEFLQLQ